MSTTAPAPARSRRELTEAIRREALARGFDRVGFAPVGPSGHAEAYRRWVAAGMAGEMHYLTRDDAIAKRSDPAVLVPGVRSAIVLVRNYFPGGDPAGEALPADRAVFARYARNDDYHELLKARLIALQEWIDRELAPLNGRAYVDTGAVLERELAARAGIGWFGRNTMLIQPGAGSYFFIGVILVDLELAYDEPFERDHCGTCASCLSACPTGALLGRDESGGPILDARRCISYLTIEARGPIPRELRPLIGNRVYGCDICQEVCPHNNTRFVQITSEEAFWPRDGVHGAALIELMGISPEEFSRRFRNSPVKRAKRRGLLRNVAVGLGNWGSPAAVPVLVEALQDDEPLVRGHAAWALGRIGIAPAREALRGREAVEGDPWVRGEIIAAMAEAAREDEIELPTG